MELNGKKVLIPVEEMFNTHEFWYPYYRLKEAGCEVVVMGSGSSETYTGKPSRCNLSRRLDACFSRDTRK
jgi:protease I